MNNKILTKMLAVMLVFTLTCANFILIAMNVNQIYAASLEYENQETAINKTNIIFDSYFKKEDGEKTHTLVSEMENEELKLYLDISVTKGYLEKGEVSITDANFRLIETDEIIDGVEKISSAKNTVTLNQISKGEEKIIELPVEIIKDELFNVSNFSTDSNVTLTGQFINDNAKEIDVKKTIMINLSLSEDANTILSGKVLNTAVFEENEVNKEHFQIEVESGVVDNALPIRATEIEIQIPELENRELEYANVYGASTKATNGNNGDGFSTENYIIENETIYIKVENPIDENGNVSWKKAATDKYIVNLVYLLKDNSEKINELELNIKSRLNLYNNKDGIVENEFIENTSLENIEDNIVSIAVNGENEIAKGYMTLTESKNTELKQNIEINIGYSPIIKEIDINKEKEIYKDEKGKVYDATTYYKRILVKKENFEKILGQKGRISIISNETEIERITLDNLEITFNEEISDLKLKTTSPITEGCLNIEVEKYIKSLEYNKKIIDELTQMITETTLKTNISEETAIKETKLTETTLQAKMEVNPSDLSTVLENENVEIRVVLQTNNNTQKLYKNPEVEIEFPSYIKSIRINSVNLFYDTQLLPDKAELKINENGNKALLLKLKGEQTRYNENTTVEGMTIVANANIVVDNTAPSITQRINAKIINNASEEIEVGTNIYYSAPLGIITLNTMSDFNEDKEVTSVSSEEKTGLIEKEAKTKIAKEAITVINNYNYNCGNMVVLGRTPSEGNKDFRTNKDLGSTFTAKMVSGLKAVTGIQDSEIEVYYSENPEATKELEESNNGWTKEVENFENIKSYLVIVNKELSKGDKIVLNYEIEIPEGLSIDESTYSMFEVYYTNLDGALSGIEEKTVSQVVGLTTKQNADLDVKIEANVNDGENVKEGQIVKYTVSVTNNGKEDLNNVKVSVDIPEQAVITKYEFLMDTYMYEYITYPDKTFENIIKELKRGETKTTTFLVEVLRMKDDAENKITVEAKASVNINEENQVSISNKISNPIVKGYFSIYLTSNANSVRLKNGAQVTYLIKIVNNGTIPSNNVEVSCKLPNNLKLISTDFRGETDIKEKISDSQITWSIDELTDKRDIYLSCEIKDIDEKIEQTVSLSINGKCDESSETIESNKEEFIAGKVELEIVQTSTNVSNELTNGDEIEYIISIKNIGNVISYNTEIKDILTKGLNLKQISVLYEDGETQSYKSSSKTNTVNIGDIRPGETVIIKVKAVAVLFGGESAITATHTFEITGDTITEKIEKSKEFEIKPVVYSSGKDSKTDAKYSISGIAWEDENKNGQREGNEKILSQIPVLLLNEQGKTINSNITNEEGSYIFKDIASGNYIVAFMYDTSNYDVTKYKAGDTALDNDTIQMNLNIEGTLILCAATNEITLNENKSNVDLGLIISPKFDLSLTKTISKITVNTAKGTKSYNYNNSILEKIEIPSSELNGATLAIEYEIKVTNNGAIAGYAKRIVDYLSSTDLKFNSELNSDWYLGTDGNLYNGTIGDTLLKTGQSITLKLILTKIVTENNTGITSNIAEIYEAYNDDGLNDYNSTVANKAQTENDLGHADIIIAVKTGVVLYIGIVLLTIAILTFGVYILNKKVIKI